MEKLESSLEKYKPDTDTKLELEEGTLLDDGKKAKSLIQTDFRGDVLRAEFEDFDQEEGTGGK